VLIAGEAESFLRAEVVQNERRRHTGVCGDVLQVRCGYAMGGETLDRGVSNPRARSAIGIVRSLPSAGSV
jgi:ribosomal protein S28E/S33